MTPRERLMDAAMEFCRIEVAMRAEHAEVRRCTEQEEPDMQCGDPGSPRCDIHGEGSLCDNCQKRKDGLPAYRIRLRKRRQAKERMMRAAAAMRRAEEASTRKELA